MTEAPTGSPRDPDYDDRKIHAAHPSHSAHPTYVAHAPGGARYPAHEPEPPFEGPLHVLSRATWQLVLVTGLASLVLGILVLARPDRTLRAAGVLFGLYLLVSGVFQVVSAFGTHRTTSLRVLAFVSGSLSVLLGLLCFRGPLQSVLLLALWIGIGWLIRGITQTLAAASDPSTPARGRQLFLGVVTLAAGIVLIESPVSSVTVLAVVGGVWLVVVGLIETVTALGIRSHARHVPRTV